MKLPATEKYIAKGIKMYKLISSEQSGFLSHKPATYDYKTVYDLEEAILLNADEGWFFVNYDEAFSNLAIMLWRDLKDNSKKK